MAAKRVEQVRVEEQVRVDEQMRVEEAFRQDDASIEVHEDQPTVEAAPAETGSGQPCGVCSAELSIIRINVDGNDLLMESCDVCDVRRWQLAGERIDLQEALDHVGEHAGRRR